MLPIFLAAALVALISSQATVNDCPAGVPRNKYLKVQGTTCYEFVTDYPLSYNDALADCKTRGGILVLDTSKNITDFLIDQLVYEFGAGDKIWVGLNDKATEGTYVWEDGTPLGAYKNFAANRNGTSQSHDCISFDPTKQGLWEEDFCSDLIFGLFAEDHNYVCQYKARGSTL